MTDRLQLRQVIRLLLRLAGVVVVAAIARSSNLRCVRGWLRGEGLPIEREAVLRFALQLARLLEAHCGAYFVQPWFKGSNPTLDNRSPAMLLKDQDILSTELKQRLFAAAQDAIS